MISFEALRASNEARQAAWPGAKVIDLGFRGNELGGEAGEAQEVIADLVELLSFSITSMRASQHVGEAQNRLKKILRATKGIKGNSKDEVEGLVQGLREEMADVIICLDLLAMDLDIDLGKAVRDKFNATSTKKGIDVMFQED